MALFLVRKRAREKKQHFRSVERIEIDYIFKSNAFDIRQKSISSDTFEGDAKRDKKKKRETREREHRFSFYLILSETCLYVGGLIVTKDEVCRDKNLGREVSSICMLLGMRDT